LCHKPSGDGATGNEFVASRAADCPAGNSPAVFPVYIFISEKYYYFIILQKNYLFLCTYFLMFLFAG